MDLTAFGKVLIQYKVIVEPAELNGVWAARVLNHMDEKDVQVKVILFSRKDFIFHEICKLGTAEVYAEGKSGSGNSSILCPP